MQRINLFIAASAVLCDAMTFARMTLGTSTISVLLYVIIRTVSILIAILLNLILRNLFILYVILLNVFLPNVIPLNVILLNVFQLNVVTLYCTQMNEVWGLYYKTLHICNLQYIGTFVVSRCLPAFEKHTSLVKQTQYLSMESVKHISVIFIAQAPE
jgi:hypothetical protein